MLLSADNCADIPSLSPRLLPETRRSGGRWLRRSAQEGPGGRAGQEGQPGKHRGFPGASGVVDTGSQSSGARVSVAGGFWKAQSARGVGVDPCWREGAGPSAAPRRGTARTGHLGWRGRLLSGAPSLGTTRWLLSARAPGSSRRPGLLASHPCSDTTPAHPLPTPGAWASR